MRKVTAAEWLLSLFTTPDRASAVAGDLLEQRGSFWFNTLRTAGALLLKSAVARPFRLLVVVLLGELLHEGARGPLIHFITGGQASPWLTSPWRLVAAPAIMGYVIARFARDSEVAACLGVAVLESIGIGVGFHYMASSGNFVFPPAILAELLFRQAAPLFVLICAGAWTRQRRYAQ